ncbi:hypothetical protein PENANT_c022G07045 [Penicillium antarcticum]|uniref:Uncharacterized protein n=1 Tax=Penicillium antarcticum TaxID=416450 RepID=A0A1V6PZA6_9EURO|nr:hypothetical protein PENANT_c022G07045 [Penicillium antarcticum]
MQKLGRVGSKLGLLGAQCWARVGPGLMKFNPGPGWVGFWAGTLGPKWALRKSKDNACNLTIENQPVGLVESQTPRKGACGGRAGPQDSHLVLTPSIEHSPLSPPVARLSP